MYCVNAMKNRDILLKTAKTTASEMEGRLNRKFYPVLKICRFETDVKLSVMNENYLRLKRGGKQDLSKKILLHYINIFC
jgi:hypothetical protein